MYSLDDFISSTAVIIAYVIFMVFPIFITIINIISFIENIRLRPIFSAKWQRKFRNADLWTIVLGIIFNAILWSVLEFKDFSEPLLINYGIDLHSPVQHSHMLTIVVIMFTGYAAYFFMKKRGTKLPPLVFVINMAFILINNYIGVAIIIQLSKNLITVDNSMDIRFYPVFYMLLLPINFLICSIALIRKLNFEYTTQISDREFNNRFLVYMNKIVKESNNFALTAFVLSFPILAVIIVILLLFGQQPDSIIKAFTETSDWTLSQKISPPPIRYDGHYLCTVSLRGHRKIVKPKRYGIRGGEKIVVNRQLMIANAFEEAIQEKLPNVHRFIRHIYDKYGFPLSKLITTQIRADIVYIIMKPLEYLFLIFLYSIYANPESRIEKQYLPLKEGKVY